MPFQLKLGGLRDSQQVFDFLLKMYFFQVSTTRNGSISILTAAYWIVSLMSQREPRALLNVAEKERDPFASIN